jgi:hypothetical protein
MPSTEAMSSMLAAATPRMPPKRCSRRARRFGADARNVFQLAAAHPHLRALGPHAGDGEAVRLVADLRHQHQRRRILAEVDLLAAIGEHQLLQADLAALALLDADDQRQRQAQFAEHLARHRHLALAAVDQHQVGHARGASLGRCFAALDALGALDALDVFTFGIAGRQRLGLGRHRLGQLAVAAVQHLAHRGVVVARRDALDVVAAVFLVLHRVVLEHHARGLRRLARRVRDVEALDAEVVQVVAREVQRLDQRAGARLLRAFFGQQAGQLQPGIRLGHLQPVAALLARLEHRRHAPAGLQRDRLDQLAAHQVAGTSVAGTGTSM